MPALQIVLRRTKVLNQGILSKSPGSTFSNDHSRVVLFVEEIVNVLFNYSEHRTSHGLVLIIKEIPERCTSLYSPTQRSISRFRGTTYFFLFDGTTQTTDIKYFHICDSTIIKRRQDLIFSSKYFGTRNSFIVYRRWTFQRTIIVSNVDVF